MLLESYLTNNNNNNNNYTNNPKNSFRNIVDNIIFSSTNGINVSPNPFEFL
jgi:hypothetical protein